MIYPAVFAKDKREILVTGEAYLDVTPDSSRPFIVKTNAFNVKVLGTQFNVSSMEMSEGFRCISRRPGGGRE